MRKWHHIDAQDMILGRLATRIANIVRGKTKRDWAPYKNEGDFVVVTNAEKVKMTSRDKVYFHHSIVLKHILIYIIQSLKII